MNRHFLLTLVLLTLAAGTAIAQSPLTGDWTARPIKAPPQNGPPSGPLVPVPAEGLRTRTPPVALKLEVPSADRLTGTVVENGRSGALVIEDGVIIGNVFTFKTRRTGTRNTETVLWKGEIVNGETIVLVRVLYRPERTASATPGPGLPGAGGAALPDDVKRAGGAIVLQRN